MGILKQFQISYSHAFTLDIHPPKYINMYYLILNISNNYSHVSNTSHIWELILQKFCKMLLLSE